MRRIITLLPLLFCLSATPTRADQLACHDDETSAAAGLIPDKYATCTAGAGDHVGADVTVLSIVPGIKSSF